jgi:hypothetical protein
MKKGGREGAAISGEGRLSYAMMEGLLTGRHGIVTSDESRESMIDLP